MNHVQELRLLSAPMLVQAEQLTRRDYYYSIDWEERLIGLLGPKGVGKTTILLQRCTGLGEKSLYVSLDQTMAAAVSISALARAFYLEGGRCLMLDEVHKYPNWSVEIKNIVDAQPQLRVVFSGSSAIRINAQKGDLSRRAAIYHLPVLSLREFIHLETSRRPPVFRLEEILENHQTIAAELVKSFSPMEFYKSYLAHGAYPFYREGLTRFWDKLRNSVLYALESDLVQIHQLDPQYIPRLKKMLQMVACEVPYTPNISALAQSLEMSRLAVLRYLQVLASGGILFLLEEHGRGYQKLAKPEKVYLDNTNLLHAFSGECRESGTLRETFCANQLNSAGHQLKAPPAGDFLVSSRFVLEVGGRKKKSRQIKQAAHGFVVRDDIEIGAKNAVPIWMLGFLY